MDCRTIGWSGGLRGMAGLVLALSGMFPCGVVWSQQPAATPPLGTAPVPSKPAIPGLGPTESNILGMKSDGLLEAITQRVQQSGLPAIEARDGGPEARPEKAKGSHLLQRWRAAQSLLRTAMLLEREAEAVEAEGNEEIAQELRSVVDELRSQVVRLLVLRR